MSASQGMKVSILGRDFHVMCKDEEREHLAAAATYLDKQMRVIQSSGKVMGVERCAIMAALNVVHELLELKRSSSSMNDVGERLRSLRQKIDDAMQEQSRLL